MPDDDTVHVDLIDQIRLLHPKQDPDFIVIRIETNDGGKHDFGLPRGALLTVIEKWAADLLAVIGEPKNLEPMMTWEQIAMAMAMTMLPMKQGERRGWLHSAAARYVECMRLAGHDETVITDNLSRMMARVIECVETLDQGGGIIGNA